MTIAVNNSRTIRFDPDAHRYFVDDIEVPSVTRAIRGVGIGRYSVNEEAAKRGTYVHAASVLIDDNNDLKWATVPDEYRPYLEGYQLFLQETGFEPVKELSERPVFNEAYQFAGTPDRVGRFRKIKLKRDGLAVVDLKTGRCPWWAALQTAAYKFCYPEDLCIENRLGVQLHENGRYSLHPYTERSDLTEFFSALTTYRLLLRHGEIKADDIEHTYDF